MLYELNHESYTLDAVTQFSMSECTASFEFGVAEDLVFNYLDEEELKKCLSLLAKKPLETLDIFCVIRYHVVKENGKRHVPLRFDHYMIRFVFRRGSVDLLVFHERGTRRVAPEELAVFLKTRIGRKLGL